MTKIYNTSCFEKLKIRPVNVRNMAQPDIEPFTYEYINPYDLDVDDLDNGWIVRTSIPGRGISNIWIVFDEDHMRLIRNGAYRFNVPSLLRPDRMTIAFLNLGVYYRTWPEMNGFPQYNVTGVWKTNIDINNLKNEKSFLEFYKTNKLEEKFNNENI